MNAPRKLTDDEIAKLKDIAARLREAGDADGLAEVEAVFISDPVRKSVVGPMLVARYEHLIRPRPWVGVDFDCTLAKYNGNFGKLGDIIPKMKGIIAGLLFDEMGVKIFTARAAIPAEVKKIQDWLEENGLPRLEVTATKDFNTVAIFDDRAVHVTPNDGTPHASATWRAMFPEIARHF